MAIPNFAASNSYPQTHVESSASGTQTITIDPRRTLAVYVYIDHANGGTVNLGGGTAVKVTAQQWELVWMQPAHPGTADTTIEIVPVHAADIHIKVY